MKDKKLVAVNLVVLFLVLAAIFNMQKIKGFFWSGQYAEVRLNGCESEKCELRGTLKISVRTGDYYLVDKTGREIYFNNKNFSSIRLPAPKL